MKTLEELQELVGQLFEREEFRFYPDELFEPIEYTLRDGGKRLRPLLLLATAQMMGGELEEAYGGALGIETFHNFTLLHDDLMDESPLRRGKPTVWHRWGTNRAVLSGDTMYAMCWRYFLRREHPRLRELLESFNESAIKVCRGQQLDMNFEQRKDVLLKEYVEMIGDKTAELLSCAMRLGAMYAHKEGTAEERAEEEKVAAAGYAMGLAFQLQDDWLDAYGDSHVFGKPTGQDIRDHKKTYLILRALEDSTPEEKAKMVELYQTPQHSEETIGTLLEAYERLEIKKKTEIEIEKYYGQAQKAMEEIKKSEECKLPLMRIMQGLLGREK